VLERRIGILVGHFGSGKTEIALNLALRLAAQRGPTSCSSTSTWSSRTSAPLGARVPGRPRGPRRRSDGELAHADLPIVLPEVRRVIADPAAAF